MTAVTLRPGAAGGGAVAQGPRRGGRGRERKGWYWGSGTEMDRGRVGGMVMCRRGCERDSQTRKERTGEKRMRIDQKMR